jgi:hypothetical protein
MYNTFALQYFGTLFIYGLLLFVCCCSSVLPTYHLASGCAIDLIELQVDLHFQLGEEKTIVTSRIAVSPSAEGQNLTLKLNSLAASGHMV